MNKYIQHLAFLKELTTEVTEQLNHQQLQRVPYAIVELLYRVKAASKGLECLMVSVEEDTELEFSSALILRTMFLDFLVSLRCQDIRDRGTKAGYPEDQINNELTAYINSVLGDGLVRTGNFMSDLHSIGHISEDKLHAVLENLSTKYEAFLEPYKGEGKLKAIYNSAPTALSLFKEISKNPFLKDLARRYEYYALYSKYEHFNIMSYETIRRDKKTQTDTLGAGVEILVMHTFQCLGILHYFLKTEFLHLKHTEVGAYIGSQLLELTAEDFENKLNEL